MMDEAEMDPQIPCGGLARLTSWSAYGTTVSLNAHKINWVITEGMGWAIFVTQEFHSSTTKKANPFQCPQRPRLTSVTSPERWYAMRRDYIFRLIFLDPSPADRAENRAVVCRRKNLNFISSHVVSSVGVATSSSSSSSTRCRNVYLRNECKAFGRGFEIITTESSPQSSWRGYYTLQARQTSQT